MPEYGESKFREVQQTVSGRIESFSCDRCEGWRYFGCRIRWILDQRFYCVIEEEEKRGERISFFAFDFAERFVHLRLSFD